MAFKGMKFTVLIRRNGERIAHSVIARDQARAAAKVLRAYPAGEATVVETRKMLTVASHALTAKRYAA